MKEFIKKYKKILIIILIILLLLGIGLGIYFIFFKNIDNSAGNNNDTEIETEMEDQKVAELPDYDERSSSEAIIATYDSAKAWSSDVKLYNCTGMTTSSLEFPDITYYFVGAESGKYARWICTYYSKSLAMTNSYVYKEGSIIGGEEPFEIGEYGYMLYDGITYPTNLESIVDSTLVYTAAMENGMNDSVNYVNMYLFNSQDYGFVWKIDERSRNDKDEYGTGLLIKAYVFDMYTGALKTISTESIN